MLDSPVAWAMVIGSVLTIVLGIIAVLLADDETTSIIMIDSGV